MKRAHPLTLWLILLATSAHAQIANGARAEIARAIREEAAQFQASQPLPENPDNGDEARYPTRIASYSKGLPHNNLGEVVTSEYQKLIDALVGPDPAAGLEALVLGGQRKLVNPLAGYAYLPEGADPHAIALRPAPLFTSSEAAGEMEELYWMALVRDVPFQSYTSNPPSLITQAIQRLNQIREYRGAKESGAVTAQSLFRSELPGSVKGPFISQFLLKDVPYGAQVISQRNLTRVPGDDSVFRFDEWLRIQNGMLPSQSPVYDPVRRYIRNGRDLAEWVHLDAPVQSSLNAALLLARMGDVDSDPKASPLVFDELSPYINYRNQEPFATLGNGDGLDLVSRIVNPALRAQWFQKWLIHRRLRPEEYGGRVHNRLTGARSYLASNVGVGRLFAGVHYRSDHEHALGLGELFALRTLQDMARFYNEPFNGFQVRTFGGNTLTITHDSPDLPVFVSCGGRRRVLA